MSGFATQHPEEFRACYAAAYTKIVADEAGARAARKAAVERVQRLRAELAQAEEQLYEITAEHMAHNVHVHMFKTRKRYAEGAHEQLRAEREAKRTAVGGGGEGGEGGGKAK